MSRREPPREPPSRCSLLVRNVARNCSVEDLRYAAEKYGRVRDVYIPRDFYTQEPRGIAFIEFAETRDAEDALHGLDRKYLEGRELSVVFAQQGRKRPEQYRGPSGGGGGGSYRDRSRSRDRERRRSRSRSRDRRRSRSRTRTRPRSYSRSPSRGRSPPRRGRSPSLSRSPRGRRDSRSASPAPAGERNGDAASPRRDDDHEIPPRDEDR